MGKRIRKQRIGRRGTKYRVPSHRYLGEIKYHDYGSGRVVDIIHAPGKTTPVAVIDFTGKRELFIPPQGVHIGQKIQYGGMPETGNVLELGKIPEGTKIYNIESTPGDGGKICRASGSFAILLTRSEDRCVVLLPSKEKKTISAKCRATIGSAAGFGRLEKPFMKAGKKFHVMRSLGRLYPRVRGVAMNPRDHPFGGSAKPGVHKTISRNVPPGRKVGSLSPVRVGKSKRKS